MCAAAAGGRREREGEGEGDDDTRLSCIAPRGWLWVHGIMARSHHCGLKIERPYVGLVDAR